MSSVMDIAGDVIRSFVLGLTESGFSFVDDRFWFRSDTGNLVSLTLSWPYGSGRRGAEVAGE